MTTETARFDTSDGLRLEGRLSTPPAPAGGVVICHPHPSYGGSMSSALVPAVQRTLVASGWAALRFNFRGVGRSEGRYGGGVAELRDVSAAVEVVARAVPDLPIAVVGWSFGAMVGLHAAVADDRVTTYVAVAPPVSIKPHMDLPVQPPPERLERWSGRALAICGTNDGFVTPPGLRRWAEAIPGCETLVIDGADHFFTAHRDELCSAVADFVAKE